MRDGMFAVVVRVVTVAACLPYLVLKVVWLSGVAVGAVDAAGSRELLDVRHLVGDVVTAGMELVLVVLVFALTGRWGRRLPALVVVAPIWLGAGLAPIALGLPLGLVAQALAGGSPVPAGDGLHDWVFAVVYGGFIVQAVALIAAFSTHARRRWPQLFVPDRPVSPGVPRGRYLLAGTGAGVSGGDGDVRARSRRARQRRRGQLRTARCRRRRDGRWPRPRRGRRHPVVGGGLRASMRNRVE